MKRRFISLVLCLTMCLTLSLSLSVSAADAPRDTSYEAGLAADLKSLGLFKGVSDTNFDLNRAPTRVEALVMLIRALGKENIALNGTWDHPFCDVPGWADKYVGYAYQNGLTNGVSATEFGSSNASAAMYLTFVLRSLGYTDASGTDFTWDNPFSLAKNVGIYSDKINITTFWRADLVTISYAALSAFLKDSNQTLAEKLISAGAFTIEQYNTYYNPSKLEPSESLSSLTAEEISEKCAPAVFYVENYSFNGEPCSLGSGFFVTSSGVGVTNYHVVENSTDITITTQSGVVYDDVKIINADKTNDIAILQVDGTNLPYLEMGDSSTLKQGQTVYAIGNPIGLTNTMSQGIVSNPSRTLDETNYIQISVPIDHGSSGGALIDTTGKVVGITSAGFNSSADLNLSIPINRVKELGIEPTGNWVLFGDTTYEGFTSALDFGAFSGVQLLDYYTTVLGTIYEYDVRDFHDLADRNAGDRYAYTLYYYWYALLENGFEQTEPINSFEGTFETDSEILMLESNLETGIITVYVMSTPQFYSEFPSLPDFGWYTGMPGEIYHTNNSIMYCYKWSDYYYSSSVDYLIEDYGSVLELAGYSYSGFYNGNTYVYEGYGMQVFVMISGTNIYLDVFM